MSQVVEHRAQLAFERCQILCPRKLMTWSLWPMMWWSPLSQRPVVFVSHRWKAEAERLDVDPLAYGVFFHGSRVFCLVVTLFCWEVLFVAWIIWQVGDYVSSFIGFLDRILGKESKCLAAAESGWSFFFILKRCVSLGFLLLECFGT